MDVQDPLDLQSLDADSIFSALTAVERAIPDLLLNVKPILAHLTTPSSSSFLLQNTIIDDKHGHGGSSSAQSRFDEDEMGRKAREGVENYLSTLEKIQYVLRQTVYYLKETKASPSTLRPPPPNAIPTPFASSLPSSSLPRGEREPAELGLYASRLESRTLDDMVVSLKALREQMEGEKGDEEVEEDGEDDGEDGMSIDPRQVLDPPG